MGLGSSAAYAVSLTNGLLATFQLRACSLSCVECNRKTPCKRQRDLINSWSFQAEKIAHGTPSGIDNSVSTFGGAISFKKGETNNIQFLEKNSLTSFPTYKHESRKENERMGGESETIMDCFQRRGRKYF